MERVHCPSCQSVRKVGLVAGEVECLLISLHLYCLGKRSGWGGGEEGDPGAGMRGNPSVLGPRKEWGIGEGNALHLLYSSGGGEGWASVDGECWGGEGVG